MRRLIKLECKCAFCSWWFVVALAIGMIPAFLDAYSSLTSYYGDSGMKAYMESCILRNIVPTDGLEGYSLYDSWLGACGGIDLAPMLFFYLVPLLAALPCGWSIADEIHSGYLKVIVPRTGRRNYFASRLLAAFLSGGAVVSLPLLFNFGLTAALLPAVTPHPYNDMYYPVSHGDLFSVIAYAHPLVYALLCILLAFLFSGLFSCLSLVAALHSRRRITALVIPYITVILCDTTRNFLNYTSTISTSPLDLTHPLGAIASPRSYVAAAWFILFTTVILIFGLRKGEKKEIV